MERKRYTLGSWNAFLLGMCAGLGLAAATNYVLLTSGVI